MNYPIFVSIFAILASISVQAVPVRVAPAATVNGQTDPNTLPEIFERNLVARQGVADDYVADVREDGSPLEAEPDLSSEVTTLESTSESTSSPAYTAQHTTPHLPLSSKVTSALANFIVEVAKATATPTQA